MWLSGTSLIQSYTTGPWYSRFLPPGFFDETTMPDFPVGEFITMSFTSMILYLFSLPIAEAAVLLYVGRVRAGETPKPMKMVKQAFSHFWPLLGGSILYGLIAFVAYIISVLILAAMGFGFFAIATGLFGDISILPLLLLIGVGAVLLLGVLVATLFFLTRLGFYFPLILFKKVLPGMAESWQLTKNHFWRLAGIVIVLIILSVLITGGFEAIFMLIFGYSVLEMLLTNLASMVTMLISFVAYGVVYFDLQLRKEATDIQEMIVDYSPDEENDKMDE